MAEAQSRVELIVNAAKAINPLRKTQQETKKLDMAVQGVNKRTATATANIQRFGVSFRSVLGPVVAVTGAVTLLSRSLRVMGEREADVAVLRNGLRGLVGDAATATEQLQKTADVLGKQTLFNEEDFTKGFKQGFTGAANFAHQMSPMAEMAAREYYGGEKGKEYADAIHKSTGMVHQMAGTLDGKQPQQPQQPWGQTIAQPHAYNQPQAYALQPQAHAYAQPIRLMLI